jgi:hypothetical protein
VAQSGAPLDVDDDATRLKVPRPAVPSEATTQPAVRRALEGPPPHRETTRAHNDSLPLGTSLMEYEIAGFVGQGGFGIVYLADDRSLQRRVAVKEYMPSQLAARDGLTQVSIRSAHHREAFEMGLRSFVNEARLLAQFDHPSLVKVFRFWEANGTAYMAMPYYEGITLKEELRRRGAPPDEAWLMSLLAPLTEALSAIHGEHCYHRDIAPDNIMLLAGSGRPVLLDFGAARRVIGDMTQALTVILKPGYAPLEQYAEMPHMSQGPWTDVYALAAVVHYAITGRTPPVAVSRVVRDDYVPLAQVAEGRYSARFLRAIDHALGLRPEERTASMAQFRDELGLDARSSEHPAPVQPRALADARGSAGPAPSGRPGKGKWLAGAALVMVALGVSGYLAWRPAPVADVPAVAAPQRDGDALAAAPTHETGQPDAVAAPSNVAPTAFSVLGEFDRIVRAQTPGYSVETSIAARQLRIGRDKLSFTVSSQRDGHVYVLVRGADGALTLLFPNTQASDNRIRAGQSLRLPHASWMLEASEPAGTEHFLVFVSKEPRDFTQVTQRREGWFQTLHTGDAAAALARSDPGPGSVLAGRVGCVATGCDEYGAARFEVDIVR